MSAVSWFLDPPLHFNVTPQDLRQFFLSFPKYHKLMPAIPIPPLFDANHDARTTTKINDSAPPE
jgi:hypothetical protein